VVKVILHKAASPPHTDRRFSRIRQAAPMCPPCNTCFLRPTRVLNPNGMSIGLVFLQGSLLWETGRRTDRQTTLGR